jgi:hypothetical protein
MSSWEKLFKEPRKIWMRNAVMGVLMMIDQQILTDMATEKCLRNLIQRSESETLAIEPRPDA